MYNNFIKKLSQLHKKSTIIVKSNVNDHPEYPFKIYFDNLSLMFN